jgi:acetoacetyl-CoA reductase
MAGRVALVTGGTRGIGRGIVERLKADGFQVAAGYAGNEEAAKACARELDVTIVKGNVGDFDDCKRAVQEVEAQLGPVEVLVNNAGITRDAMLHKMTPQQWNEVIFVNLASVFNMCRQVIDGMRTRSFGRIINISSINGQKGQMGQTNYSAAKAGVIGFTKALAQETAAKGITVNAVAPGYIDTEMVSAVPQAVLDKIIGQIPVGRLGKAQEIAACVAFLARDDAAFITGSTITANGGQYYTA